VRAKRARAWALVAVVCAVPRLAVALHERGDIVAGFTEKSWDFAQTFVASGTFGFVEGIPSANTQPLYAFFLIPLVWIWGTAWLAVALAQIAVAVAVAILVFEIARRVTSHHAAVLAAVVATLQPYLVWHDVHVNREILDQLLGAAMVLLALVAVARHSWRYAAALGAVTGLAILSNTRLVGLPLVLGAYVLWAFRRRGLVPALAVVAAAAVVIAPWVVRNKISVGCYAITTDSRALWKANNLQTYDLLAHGKWIDDVDALPGAPPWPELVADEIKAGKNVPPPDECAQMRLYDHEVWSFWRHHPGEKARLMAQATVLLWQPSVHRSEGGPETTGGVDRIRSLVEPLYLVPLYLLALGGLLVVPRTFRVLALAFAAYETLAAWVFAGTTRYRVAWDFVLAVLAAAALAWLVSARAEGRAPFSRPFRRPLSQNR
jgi:4-amino-4-deoxy-L-arabinose transferase-like glycosyltransferase